MTEYVTVSCRLPAALEDALAAALQGWPVLGCQVEDAGAEVAVTLYLEASQAFATEKIHAGLSGIGARQIVAAPFAGQDWLAEYRERVIAREVGESFWIDPHPMKPTPPPPGRHHLIVEPRQAFGTGSHESTRLVLLVLESDPPLGARVLDVGCGSGILAIAAKAHGAGLAVGLDLDPEAAFVARQTVAVQPLRRPVHLVCGSIGCLAPPATFDLVLANLLPGQAAPLLSRLRDLLAPTGRLVLSGLMVDQQAAVEAELRAVGLGVANHRVLGEWVALVCLRL